MVARKGDQFKSPNTDWMYNSFVSVANRCNSFSEPRRRSLLYECKLSEKVLMVIIQQMNHVCRLSPIWGRERCPGQRQMLYRDEVFQIKRMLPLVTEGTESVWFIRPEMQFISKVREIKFQLNKLNWRKMDCTAESSSPLVFCMVWSALSAVAEWGVNKRHKWRICA